MGIAPFQPSYGPLVAAGLERLLDAGAARGRWRSGGLRQIRRWGAGLRGGRPWRGRCLTNRKLPQTPRAPRVPGDHGANRQRKEQQNTDGQAVDHAALAKFAAASRSTATRRETPFSCMVTPISCSANSIAILLWVMNRNCVCADIERTISA